MATIIKNLAIGSDDGGIYNTTFKDDSNSLQIGWDIWDDVGDCKAFIFISNINIPKNTIVNNAILTISVYEVGNGYVTTKLRGSAGNTNVSSLAEFNALVSTTAYQPLSFPEGQGQYIQIDVKDIVQERVNSASWKQGDNVLFYTADIDKEVSTAGVDLDSFEYNPSGTTFELDYNPPVVIEQREIFSSNRIERFEYELLSLENGIYVHNSIIDDYMETSSIKLDFTRDIIGSAVFDIDDSLDINYLSDLIRPWYIVNYQGVEYRYPLGTYMLSSPTRKSDGMLVTRKVNAFDLLLALDQDKITTSVTYPIGTNVISTITSLLTGVGTWVNYSIESNDETLSEPMTYAIGKSKLFVINSLLNTVNYYPLWVNGKGVFCAIPWSETQNISWNFEDSLSSLYESGIESELDYSAMYNKVIVVCNQATTDVEPLTATLTFEDIAMSDHPLSYTSIGRYVTRIFQSEAVSQDYVDLRARRELLKMLELEESMDYNHAFVTSRESDGLPYQGDCYSFKNTLLGSNSVYKVESQSMSLRTGFSVSSKIRRVIYG